MADQEVVFRNCTPSGPTQFARVRPGTLLDREWTMRVNDELIVNSFLNNQAAGGTLDPRRISRGYDGRLYDDVTGEFLAQVNTFEARINPATVDYQGAGRRLVAAINVSYTLELTFTETLVTDKLLQRLVAGLAVDAADPVFTFRGRIIGR